MKAMRWLIGCGFAALCLHLSACADVSRIPGDDGKMTFQVPRASTSNEALYAQIAVGSLPRNARVIVRLKNGEIAGTIAPYGVRAGQKSGTHTIRIPANAISDGKVSLKFEVKEKDADVVRPPKKDEIEGAVLEFRSITRTP
jgi:hypothetical protein